MRKPLFLLLMCSLVFLLCGCSGTTQVEDLAFAELLGVDLNERNEIEVSIEVPKIAGQRGDSGSGSSGGSSPQLIYSADGENFDEALNLLQWAVPRRLDLSQIKLIVISRDIAESEFFASVADTIMATPRLYTAARLAVCDGSAKEFISAEEPVIGTRLSSELTATFEDYIRSGFIPDATFAGFYYSSRSIYSDPLAIHAESAPKNEPASATDGGAAPAAAIIPDNPQQSGVEMQHSNRFLGAAVFRKGCLAGRLSGEEYLYCKILRGEQQTFPFSIDGRTVGLTTMGAPSVVIDTKSSPMKIRIGLNMSIVSSSKTAPKESLQSALEEAFTDAIEACRRMGAEPLRLAEKAASAFLTIEDWQEFNWTDHFLESEIDVGIRIFSSSE